MNKYLITYQYNFERNIYYGSIQYNTEAELDNINAITSACAEGIMKSINRQVEHVSIAILFFTKL